MRLKYRILESLILFFVGSVAISSVIPDDRLYLGYGDILRDTPEYSETKVTVSGLKVLLEPRDAIALLDQVPIDTKTGSRIKLDAGSRHFLRIESEGNRSYEAWLEMPSSGGLDIRVSLAETHGRLLCTSDPIDSYYFVDRYQIGKGCADGKRYILLRPGRHELSLQRFGYYSYTTIVTISDGEETKIDVSMRVAQAAISIGAYPAGNFPGSLIRFYTNGPGSIRLSLRAASTVAETSSSPEANAVLFEKVLLVPDGASSSELYFEWDQKDKNGTRLPEGNYTAFAEFLGSLPGSGSASESATFSISYNTAPSYGSFTLNGSPGFLDCPFVDAYPLIGSQLSGISVFNLSEANQALISYYQWRVGLTPWLELDFSGGIGFWGTSSSSPRLSGNASMTLSILRPSLTYPLGIALWAGLGGSVNEKIEFADFTSGTRFGLITTLHFGDFGFSLAPSILLETGSVFSFSGELSLAGFFGSDGLLNGISMSMSTEDLRTGFIIKMPIRLSFVTISRISNMQLQGGYSIELGLDSRIPFYFFFGIGLSS